MEILTEFDELQEAMKKINMNESIMPYVNGILVNDVAYNKVQRLLNCPEMISAHKFLYNLDLDQLNEDEISKIDKLYKLGCDRGFIVDDLTDWDAETSDDAAAEKPEAKPEEQPAEKPIAGTLFKAKVPCWTVIYSAVSKDGEIKTGEAYSTAISGAAAKADVKSKLSNIGYTNISILAIESCECDVDEVNVKTTSAEVEENDMLKDKPHNAHVPVSEEDEEAADDNADKEKSDETDEESSDSSDEEKKDEMTVDDSSEEDADDESSKESSDEEDVEEITDDAEETSDEKSDEKKDDEKSDEDSDEKSDEESADDDSEKSDDEESNEKKDDEESDEKSDEDKSDDEEEKSDEDSDEEELDQNQKNELKSAYKKAFKNAMVKCKFEGSFNDLTLEQKVKFFTELSKTWKKNEPTEFMTDKEIEQLNNVVVKPDEDAE